MRNGFGTIWAIGMLGMAFANAATAAGTINTHGDNGREVNGIRMQGREMNGTMSQGRAPNGNMLQGRETNGSHYQGRHLNGTHVNSKWLSGGGQNGGVDAQDPWTNLDLDRTTIRMPDAG